MNSRLIGWTGAAALVGVALLGYVAGNQGVSISSVATTPAHAQSADDGVANLKSQSRAFVQIANRVLPSVVSITSSKLIRPASGDGNPHSFGDDLMRRFFEDNMPEEFNQQGSGSGVIMNSDGYILTNNHVVANADELDVTLYDGRTATAKLIGRDEESDVAVIKIDLDDLSPAKFGDSDKLEVGEWVLAAGNPFQLTSSITSGIVSAKGRSRIGLANYEDFIQTDAAINPGNSGGALVNLDAEVIGINTAIATRSGGYQGIGFAIPINMASDLAQDLISDGKVTRGFLGVTIRDLDEVMAEYYGLHEPQGSLVQGVEPGGPADRSGLEQGDVITSVNGHEIKDSDDLKMRVARLRPGTDVDVEVMRDKRHKSVSVQLGEKNANATASNETTLGKESSYFDKLGLEVEDLSRAAYEEFDIDRDVEGVLVTDVKALSPAGKANFRSGDVIIKVDDDWIEGRSQLEKVLNQKDSGDPVLFLVVRAKQELFLAARMP
ncbi:MAG: DegQ family serine endoprotease [Candidatus Eisenbacteria bacterium]|uniref:DegQ family serine endoprotease n=1 Tax=Eiseniibacteriota bacterium TaxID=2212470 RepID=A0A956SDU0_UNCEI|nr:DegQ family serine endoprotease [Candidatus Eisenbacteria bacterium]